MENERKTAQELAREYAQARLYRETAATALSVARSEFEDADYRMCCLDKALRQVSVEGEVFNVSSLLQGLVVVVERGRETRMEIAS